MVWWKDDLGERLHRRFSLDHTLAVLTASMSIGDASLCFAAFAAGKACAGAFKMLETINRNLEIDVYNSGIIFDDICGNIEIKTCMF